MRLIDAENLTELEDLLYEYEPERNGEPWYMAKDVWECIEKAPTIEVPTWVSVEERLPDNKQRVLVRMIDGTMDVWEFQNYGIGWWQSAIWKYRTEAITHWMPLPQAPKDGE